MCEGLLEKALANRPDKEEIAVDESSMTLTFNVMGIVKQKLTHCYCLIEYAHNDNKIKWKISMAQIFFFHPSSIFAFIFTQFKSLYLIKSFLNVQNCSVRITNTDSTTSLEQNCIIYVSQFTVETYCFAGGQCVFEQPHSVIYHWNQYD